MIKGEMYIGLCLELHEVFVHADMICAPLMSPVFSVIPLKYNLQMRVNSEWSRLLMRIHVSNGNESFFQIN